MNGRQAPQGVDRTRRIGQLTTYSHYSQAPGVYIRPVAPYLQTGASQKEL